jgi:benzil reductase ((S)-benzoin forming)
MKVAIVTGVSRGLGESLAAALLAQGFHVLGLGRGSAARLEGPNYQWVAFDLAQVSQVDAALGPPFAALAARRPTFACLVNNAAVPGPVGVLGSLPAGELAQSLAINLAAPAALCNLFCRVFADAATERRIVNISSGAASNAFPGGSLYSVAKSGLEMLTRALAVDHPDDNLKAVTVRPGIIDTGMQAFMRTQPKERLPAVAMFEDFHKDGRLVPPDTTAGVIVSRVVSGEVDNGRTYTYQELVG